MSIAGKLELEYEGEPKGSERAARRPIREDWRVWPVYRPQAHGRSTQR